MKIYLVTAEHFGVPGRIIKPFDSNAKARKEAASLVRLMLKDTPASAKLPTLAEDDDEFQAALEALENYHGAAHCYVEIAPLEVL